MAGKDLRDGGLSVNGLHWRADFTLVDGRIVHDYLASKGGQASRGG